MTETAASSGEAESKKAKWKAKQKRRKERWKAKRRELRIASLPKPTDHARDRWRQRFRDDECFEDAYNRSQPIPWETIAFAVKSSGLRLRLSPESEFRYDGQTGAVFVIGSDGGPAGGKELRTVVRLCLNKLRRR